jgi:hypothetical protein
LVRYIFVRNLSTVLGIWPLGGQRRTSPSCCCRRTDRALRTRAASCASTAATMRSGARFRRFQMKGPLMRSPSP